jgi:hypothetical protein
MPFFDTWLNGSDDQDRTIAGKLQFLRFCRVDTFQRAIFYILMREWFASSFDKMYYLCACLLIAISVEGFPSVRPWVYIDSW